MHGNKLPITYVSTDEKPLYDNEFFNVIILWKIIKNKQQLLLA